MSDQLAGVGEGEATGESRRTLIFPDASTEIESLSRPLGNEMRPTIAVGWTPVSSSSLSPAKPSRVLLNCAGGTSLRNPALRCSASSSSAIGGLPTTSRNQRSCPPTGVPGMSTVLAGLPEGAGVRAEPEGAGVRADVAVLCSPGAHAVRARAAVASVADRTRVDLVDLVDLVVRDMAPPSLG